MADNDEGHVKDWNDPVTVDEKNTANEITAAHQPRQNQAWRAGLLNLRGLFVIVSFVVVAGAIWYPCWRMIEGWSFVKSMSEDRGGRILLALATWLVTVCLLIGGLVGVLFFWGWRNGVFGRNFDALTNTLGEGSPAPSKPQATAPDTPDRLVVR